MKVIQEEIPLDIHWHSFELRPVGSPPITEAYKERILAARPRFASMMKDEFDIDIQYGKFGVNSRPSLVGAKVAESISPEIGQAYHWAVLHAYWQEAADISDLDVLGEIAESAGISKQTFLDGLDQPHFQAQVTADIEQSFQYGISSVPSMILIDQFMVVGAHPTPTLKQAIQQIASGEVSA